MERYITLLETESEKMGNKLPKEQGKADAPKQININRAPASKPSGLSKDNSDSMFLPCYNLYVFIPSFKFGFRL